jgi:hypothetical protein
MKSTKSKIFSFVVAAISLNPLSVTAANISINPMFLKIYGGGQQQLLVSNKTGTSKIITLRILDEHGLKSKHCEVSDSQKRLMPNSTYRVNVNCKKNRDKGVAYVEIDQSEFEARELRRVVLYR